MSNKHVNKLGELASTAICGNDISSSCLYVSALAIIAAGQYAWLSLLIVAFVLFLFRKIYGEVVGALPLNGGAYNALLNTTSKQVASLAACLTILSYMATAVISANEAMHYVNLLYSDLPVMYATGGLLLFFMFLTILGIGESSIVAIVIFIFHISSLVLLVLVTAFFLIGNGLDVLMENMSHRMNGSITNALFFGFAAAMLGISGFESSANFVEEQAKGVFPKTLRNMWVVVSVFNPLIAFLVLACIPMGDVPEHKNALLAHLGDVASGKWLSVLISIDAAMVLSGAVLTSFVGVGGLMQRMALDRILPQVLLKKTKKDAPYMIMILFFIMSVSVLVITKGDVELLAGVYTISFLAVMALFGIGNILLKVKRSRLPRPVKAGPVGLFIAITAVVIALAGNVMENHTPAVDTGPDTHKPLTVFLEYFIPTIGLIAIMLYRIQILRGTLYVIRYISWNIHKVLNIGQAYINRLINIINSQEFVFFTKDDNVAVLNKVMIYTSRNENTNKIKIVTVLEDESKELPEKLLTDIEVLDRAYPEIDIEFVKIYGSFGPELIEELSVKWKIPMNFMFIGSPGDKFPYRIEDLGGVRLII